MGALIGLLLGLGLALVLWSGGAPPAARATVRPRLSRAKVALAATSCATGLVTFGLAFSVSGAFVVATAFGALGASVPQTVARHRAAKRRESLRSAWPDVVDDLTSAVRAGLALPEALTQLGARGPLVLRPAFRRFGDHYAATGVFGPALTELKVELADPVGDRVIEALRMAREVGGSDLGRLLRTLSGFLRDDARTRSELESRQAWAVNGARLAVAAPWLVLALLSLHPEAVRAYDSSAGFLVLLLGGSLSVVAYRLMLRLGRLPQERRVFR